MLKIRLTRVGRKNLPFYRIVVAEERFSPRGKFIEIVGHFNPRNKEKTLTLMEDRIKYWLSKGAAPTGVVHNFLVDKGIINLSKVKVTKARKASAAEVKEGNKGTKT